MKQLRRDESGFTLIELMVVLLIILILVGIAIPSFMGSRDSARDTEAKAEIRQALPSVKAYIIDGGNLADIATGVKNYSPTIAVDPAGAAGVKFLTSTDGAVCVIRQSDTGNVYAVWEPSLGLADGTLYAELTAVPTTCPTLANTGAAGYSATAW